MHKIFLIIQREFLERVSKKSFIVVTILMPLLMLIMSCLPALIMAFAETDLKTVAVVETGTDSIAAGLTDTEELRYVRVGEPLDTVLRAEGYDAILFIPEGSVERPAQMAWYSNGPVSLKLTQAVESQLDDIIETRRIEAQGIDNLRDIMESIHADVSLRTFRNDQEETSESSSALSFALGLGLSFILYMFLLIYGQMVMTSIIEEKNNRVLELVVTSVKPIHLMLGKIFGVASVAVVQILIWIALLCCISAFVLPATLPTGLMTEVTAANAGTLNAETATYDAELVQVVASLGSVGYILNILFVMLLFVLGGFLFYAAIFAAIGSAVDNIQDASQLQTIIVLPIIIGLILAVTVASDPTSTIGVVCSYIPFTSPMVMMARIPFGIGAWEIVLSLVVLYLSFIFMAWVAGKVYRVGIFMYGKKPSYRDLLRWMRQS
ncbi:MAG: ABC transporter permease [Candidatus Amulumruptor caecigallinarius]|nr:ABC transporter permease [Candidatus Amulumruptor caecigallinarius]MCM1397220.1 ABC transporter permease [Candidatus Amulumruptor caecigallinarius]MCM1454783.1 ABC transporter permease [bacterium]